LNKVGKAEKEMGSIEKEFVQKSNDCFLQPLKSFIDGQMKTIQVRYSTMIILY
jgi:endophilin-B1